MWPLLFSKTPRPPARPRTPACDLIRKAQVFVPIGDPVRSAACLEEAALEWHDLGVEHHAAGRQPSADSCFRTSKKLIADGKAILAKAGR